MIINSPGVNYDTMRTDEEITALAQSAGVKIATGSYKGTGSAKALTFEFAPKLIFLKSMVNTNNLYLSTGFWFYGNAYMYEFATVNYNTMLTGETMSCTVSGNKATIPAGLSQSGATYYYIAIG